MSEDEPKRRLRVLTPAYYGMAFVTPRQSRHELVRRPYKAPWRRLWRPLDAMAIGLRAGDCDVVHSYNRIPLTRKPFIVTFESWFPRTLAYGSALFAETSMGVPTPGKEPPQSLDPGRDRRASLNAPSDFGLRRFLMARLARPECRRVVAMSDYAKNVLTLLNADSPHLEAVLRKSEIVYPNVPLRADGPKTLRGGPLRILFVGNDFAQKGGVAAVRLAHLARNEGVPVEVHVVSAMRYGKTVFADCPTPGAYDDDLELLQGENVRVHGALPNEEVLALMRSSDFLLLTSLDDTFGFSVIEAMSVGTPAIVSNVCALPELVQTGVNGCVVELPLDRFRKWTELRKRDWASLSAAYGLFAQRSLGFLRSVADNPSTYEHLSAGACDQIRGKHDADTVGTRLDDIYEEAAR
jgi:glycosyltransferase involved in cell wall biosynthesis